MNRRPRLDRGLSGIARATRLAGDRKSGTVSETAASSSSELKFSIKDSEHVRFILPSTKVVLCVVNSLDGVGDGVLVCICRQSLS
ncbi:hypothetical protein BST65_01110, partial [Bradyrhizobium canariense]